MRHAPGYQLVAELSRNQHTVVYRAARVDGGSSVIVKTLAREYPAPADIRRLTFEHRVLTKLQGPGIVQVLELAGPETRPALILEDFGARDLGAHRLPLGIEEFFRAALQIADAVGRMHALSIIHKDIKPQNLIAADALEPVKLIDFQIASEIFRERHGESGVTLEGSLPYISPEQTGRMNRALDYRSDYYSLGVTLFELVTGELPLSASDAMGWLHCHISKVPPLAHEVDARVPRALSVILHKLMAKDPAERYQSARGLLSDLARCRAEWLACGDEVSAFPLGEQDVAEHFSLSQQIVGRKQEAERLVKAFDSASRGPGKLLLVSGYSGVGKSSLIREVHRPLTAKQGYFTSGKFDQLDRSLPYAALAEALGALVRQLLAEPDREIQRWRARLSEALGVGASVMIELVPELVQLIGPQPPAPALDPGAAQNRFKFVLSELIEALASAERPLVIFLDDLQWADAATAELIADLFCAHQIHHLLLIGAYRDHEVHEDHALSVAVRKLESAAPDAFEQIVLTPLAEAEAGEIVAGTLKCTADECRSLTREIHAKTGGNPFFVGELLLSLYRSGSLVFQPERGRWTWDPEGVKRLSVSDNVVDLLVRRLESLDADAIVALRVAACVGGVFSLATLSDLLGRSPDATARALWAPLREGLILPLDADYRLMSVAASNASTPPLEVSYRFQHDRVQQAAYSLIPTDERAELHLGIGRRLLEATGGKSHDLFTATNHLNLGFARMQALSERERLAELNRAAGKKAMGATAFTVAAAYHDAAARCLDPAEWAARPELRFRVLSERALSVLMAGERERAAALVDELFELAPTRADRASAWLAKCRVMVYQGKPVEAIAAVREGLVPLGIELPSEPAAIEQRISVGVARMLAHMARVPLDELVNLPDSKDPERIVAMQLLFEVVPPATVVYPPLFVLAELEMFDLALTHGITPESAKNFVDCGLIQGAVLGDYATAYRLGKLAFRVIDRYQARALAGQVHFVFATYVSPWGAPYAESLVSFRESCRLGMETGDHTHLAFARALELRMLLHLGRHLDHCAAEVAAAESLFERIRATIPRDAVRLVRRAIECLRDPLDDVAEAERLTAQLTSEISASGNAQWNFQHAQAQMMVSAVLGDWEAAERHATRAAAYQQAASTLFTVPEYHLLDGLVTAYQRWPRADAARRAELWAELGATLAKLESWANGQPENFEHKYHLLAAEVARLEGQPAPRVAAHYDAAVAATGADFLHLRALALELHGRYWLAQGSRRLSEPLLAEALTLYAGWGALAKVRRLERECTQLFELGPSRADTERGVWATIIGRRARTLFETNLLSQALDLGSVLKATQAISGEVRSERLFARLMHTILENAAAQHGALILPEEGSGELLVRAWAEAPVGDKDVSLSRPLEQERRICPEMVRVTARTLEPLVIDDAAAHPTFGSLDYVRRGGVKSVLCMPVVHQGALAAVLYVENGATTHAFTAGRVETLRLIAGQAAISITNASLYSSLERKVAARTRELSAKTKKIAAMLDGMQQAVFTIDEDLCIQPEHSRYLEELAPPPQPLLGAAGPSGPLVGRSLNEVLFHGAELGAEALIRHESALRCGFGATLVMAQANADHLIRSYQRRAPDGSVQHLEVDWNWITDETGRVDAVLVAARDVTRLRSLEQTAARAVREATVLAELLDAGVDGAKSFCESARQGLRQHAQRLAPGGVRAEQVRALFRDVHTLKGHCRTLGLHGLVEAAHRAEQACAPEPGSSALLSAGARDALSALDAAFEEYQLTGEKRLGHLWAGRDLRLDEALAAIDSALTHAPERPSYPVRALCQVRQALERATAVPLRETLRESARVFPSLARELGKGVPELVCSDDGTLLASEWSQVLRDAFVHTFRNSLDHGIEPIAERQAAGKPPEGTIRLSTERGADGVVIRLADDGRGLPIERLRQKTGTAGSSDAAVVEAIFEFGVSTAEGVSTVSGRGIGMDVVRALLRERGGDVVIEFTGEAQGGYRPFQLVFKLPSGATLPAC